MLLSKPEVTQLDLVCTFEENVERFDIPMQYPSFVKKVNTKADLDEEREDRLLRYLLLIDFVIAHKAL